MLIRRYGTSKSIIITKNFIIFIVNHGRKEKTWRSSDGAATITDVDEHTKNNIIEKIRRNINLKRKPCSTFIPASITTIKIQKLGKYISLTILIINNIQNLIKQNLNNKSNKLIKALKIIKLVYEKYNKITKL